MAGRWKRKPSADVCVYTSNRGAIFATVAVDQPVRPGLAEARAACLPGVRPIKTAHAGFVCVEKHDDYDTVTGNTASRGQLWLATIVLPVDADPTAQLAAMVSLMNAVPR